MKNCWTHFSKELLNQEQVCFFFKGCELKLPFSPTIYAICITCVHKAHFNHGQMFISKGQSQPSWPLLDLFSFLIILDYFFQHFWEAKFELWNGSMTSQMGHICIIKSGWLWDNYTSYSSRLSVPLGQDLKYFWRPQRELKIAMHCDFKSLINQVIVCHLTPSEEQ